MSLVMFVAVITLSSWRLFGKQIDGEPKRLKLPSQDQCVEHAVQDKYLFGFRTQDDVPVERVVDCESGAPLTDWYQY